MTKHARISCRGLLVHEGKILLLNIDDREYWNAPGGGYKAADASMSETVIREMKEEAGMDVVVEHMVYVQEFQSEKQASLVLFYLVSPKDPSQYKEFVIDPDNPERKTRLKWFEIDGEEYKSIRFLPETLQKDLHEVIQNKSPLFTSNVKQ